jgi:hypothetical protein
MTLLRLILLLIGIWIAELITAPLWAGPADSLRKWIAVEKPAECFSIGTVTIGHWRIRSCADWKHCDADAAVNEKNGYLCSADIK